MTKLISAVLAIFFILPVTPAWPNDSAASVDGLAIAPVQGEVDTVRLEKEILNIRFADDYYAYVDVTFFLKNESPEPVTIAIGFPDERATVWRNAPKSEMEELTPDDWFVNWYGGYTGWIEDFTCTVDGKKVETTDRTQTLPYERDVLSGLLNAYWNEEPPQGEFPFNLGPQFLHLALGLEKDLEVVWKSFVLSWAPGETHKVHHTFKAYRGSSIGWAPHITSTFEYTLITGKSWKGTIGELVVTATLDPEVNFEWLTGEPGDEWAAINRLLWGNEMEAAYPPTDEEGQPTSWEEYYPDWEITTGWLERVDSRTLRGVKTNWEPSSSDSPVVRFGASMVEYYALEQVFPDSATELIPAETLAAMPLSLLRYGRNEIYARHGRKFADEWLQSCFEDKTWYTPDPSYRSPRDDDERLSEIEKKNIALIKAEENRRRHPK
ncbi:MAG: YARHG domain-containing protein [bacterium]|jgi:hypothetical protein